MKPASAPGKLFLLGEYAVLHESTALLTAVDRRVFVRPRQHRQSSYQVHGASLDAPRRLPLSIARMLDIDPRNIEDLYVDISALYHNGTKLGLGSSAASTVALLRSMAPDLPEDQQLQLALQAHRHFQGGSGSGADIAACFFDGLIAYQVNDPASTTPQICVDSDLFFPEDLQLYAVWTGAPAQTTSFVDAVARQHHSNPLAIESIFDQISETAQAGINALHSRDTFAFIRALAQGDSLMETLGRLCAQPIITDAHRHLRTQAKNAGFVAKPSGAGGGDFSLLAAHRDVGPPPSFSSHCILNLHPIP